ncbi:MAG: tRNA adenosine(34) deaminase TadA [Candidatus Kapaibacterium sp.]
MRENSAQYFMNEALKLAENCSGNGEIPIGALVVKGCDIIGKGRNRVEELSDPTAHAEIEAIREAVKTTGYKHLNDCDMYVTLEPCSMCAGALILARIRRLYIGAEDPKTGACGSVYSIPADGLLNHRIEVYTGILGEECSTMLKNFFKKLREPKNA